MPILSLLFLSQTMAAVLLSLIFFSKKRRIALKEMGFKSWIKLLGISGLYFMGFWILFSAISLMDPTLASFLGRSEVLVTLLFAVILLGERFTRIEILGAMLVLLGALTIRFVSEMDISNGFWLCMAAALIFGITEGLAKMVALTIPPLMFAWGRSLLLILPFLFTAMLSKNGLQLPKTPSVWLGIACLAAVGPVLGRVFYMKSLTLIPVSKAALINQLQPVWVAVFAVFLFGGIPSLQEWGGGLLILGGCVLLVKKATVKGPYKPL